MTTTTFFQRIDEAQAKAERVVGWLPPAVLPPDWRQVRRSEDGASYTHRRGFTAIVSTSFEDDGSAWLHLSVAHPRRAPGWGDMRRAKELFLGDRWAVSVLPREVEYVNIHPFCLHLFAPLDGARRLPDFTRGTGSL